MESTDGESQVTYHTSGQQTTVKIRPMTYEDIDIVAKIERMVSKKRWSRDKLIKEHPSQNMKNRAYVIEICDKISGFFICEVESSGLHILRCCFPNRFSDAIREQINEYFGPKFESWLIENKIHIIVNEEYELLEILKKIGFKIQQIGKVFSCVLKVQ